MVLLCISNIFMIYDNWLPCDNFNFLYIFSYSVFFCFRFHGLLSWFKSGASVPHAAEISLNKFNGSKWMNNHGNEKLMKKSVFSQNSTMHNIWVQSERKLVKSGSSLASINIFFQIIYHNTVANKYILLFISLCVRLMINGYLPAKKIKVKNNELVDVFCTVTDLNFY